jgi:glycosyltransferase involved in cell wall biosynthesis
MRELVSILVPAFNAERWIGDCLESALSQTWPRTEVIVVDDGSRDATLRIARSFTSSRVRVVAQENRGASAARNHALSLAQGDYIQWLDADDVLAPDKVALQLQSAESGRTSLTLLSGPWGKFYRCPQRSRFVRTSLWEDLDPVEWLVRKVDGNLWMAIESWLVSRRLTELSGPWDEGLSLDDDGEYFCRVVGHSRGTRFVCGARCFCRRGIAAGLSQEAVVSDRKMESQAASLAAHVRILRSLEDSARTRAACVKLLARWSDLFWPARPDLFERLQRLSLDLGAELSPPGGASRPRWKPRIGRDIRRVLLQGWEQLSCLASRGRGGIGRQKVASSGDYVAGGNGASDERGGGAGERQAAGGFQHR